jgi:hypothetical protein
MHFNEVWIIDHSTTTTKPKLMLAVSVGAIYHRWGESWHITWNNNAIIRQHKWLIGRAFHSKTKL